MPSAGSRREREQTDSPRLQHAASILAFGWNRPAFTASDLISATGLTRTTVIALCAELVERGWLVELADSRAAGAAYRHGRPARRYALRPDAGVVGGVDAGTHTITAIVADLRGTELARVSRRVDPAKTTATDRLAATDAVIDDALKIAAPVENLLCLAIGVPAPVDSHGRTPQGRDVFWQRMNPAFGENLSDRGCTVIVDNDANLAAVAEGALGAGSGVDSYITLVSGERFGAGYVIDGTLVRGRGMVGELQLLELIEGVGSSKGIGALLRSWARGVREDGGMPEDSVLAAMPVDELSAETVLCAADDGDEFALSLVQRMADRLARVCSVLGGLLDVDRIIFGGAVASSMGLLLRLTAEWMPQYGNQPPPELVASTLGADMVSLGAVTRAIDHVQRHALEIHLRTV